MRTSILSSLILVGCESYISETVMIEVADTITPSYTEDAPGLLRTDASENIVAVLCGETISEPFVFSDEGFGCIREVDTHHRTERTAWIEPAPEAWDHEALCALPSPQPEGSGLYIDPEVVGHSGYFILDLFVEPEPEWPQGTGKGTWQPVPASCGGDLSITIEIQ